MAPEFLGEDYQLFHVLFAPASVFFYSDRQIQCRICFRSCTPLSTLLMFTLKLLKSPLKYSTLFVMGYFVDEYIITACLRF